jgi:hypothetical protein
MEAAAIGSGSNSLKASATGRPSSASRSASIAAWGAGATRSWRRDSSAMTPGGTRSARVDRSWPSLTNMPPHSSRASRSRRAVGEPGSTSSCPWGRPRPSDGPNPCLTAIRMISA